MPQIGHVTASAIIVTIANGSDTMHIIQSSIGISTQLKRQFIRLSYHSISLFIFPLKVKIQQAIPYAFNHYA